MDSFALAPTTQDEYAEAVNELHQAVLNRNIVALSAILDRYPALIDAPYWKDFAQEEMIQGEMLTPLMRAALGGNFATVQLLLQRGASLKKENEEGNNVLHYAAQQSNEAVVALLSQKAPDLVNAQNKHGETPLMRAAETGFSSIVERLLGQGAIVTLLSKGKNTILHYATAQSNEEIVGLLLKHVSHLLDAANTNGETPLMLAARDGTLSTVQLLLQRGASLEKENEEGDSVLHYAAQQSNEEIVKLLLKHVSHLLDAANTNGETPLMLAAQEGTLSTVQLLLSKRAHRWE